MQYQYYEADDFLELDRFRAWVMAPTPALERFWSRYMEAHPYKRQTIGEARTILLAILEDHRDEPEKKDYDEVWAKLLSRIEKRERHPDGKVVPLSAQHPTRKQRRKRWSAAAVAAISIGIALSLWLLGGGGPEDSERLMIVHAGPDAIKHLYLPDSSLVVLNEGASIRYGLEWSATTEREVWTEGEVFFDVRHMADDRRFVVHAPRARVEVLGTSFNVKDKGESTEVVLAEGSIRLAPENQRQNEILMIPGELVRVEQHTTELLRVDPREYTDWRYRELHFADQAVEEIVRRIEAVYGVQVEVPERRLAERRFTFTGPTDDLDLMLTLLEKGLNVTIERESDSAITIKQN